VPRLAAILITVTRVTPERYLNICGFALLEHDMILTRSFPAAPADPAPSGK
jgi:hypothetical protein